jgi:hypothetical protein
MRRPTFMPPAEAVGNDDVVEFLLTVPVRPPPHQRAVRPGAGCVDERGEKAFQLLVVPRGTGSSLSCRGERDRQVWQKSSGLRV